MGHLPSASLSHIIMYVYDFPMMMEFYTREMGFHLSDIGTARGNDICFMTLDPEIDHHQLGLSSGRTGDPDAGSLNHLAFRLKSLGDLRIRYEALKAADKVSDIDPITHGSWLSVYYRDPENNRMEFFVDTPWYVKQPVVDKLDMSLSDEEMMRLTEETFRDAEVFRPMSDWKAETARKFHGEDA